MFFILFFVVLSCKRAPESNITSLPGQHVTLAGYNEILDNLNRVLNQEETSPSVFLDASFIAYSYNDINTSRKFLNKYFQDHEDDPRAYYLSGCLYLKNDDPL